MHSELGDKCPYKMVWEQRTEFFFPTALQCVLQCTTSISFFKKKIVGMPNSDVYTAHISVSALSLFLPYPHVYWLDPDLDYVKNTMG